MSLWIKFNVSESKAGALLKMLALADVEELGFGVVESVAFTKNKPSAKRAKVHGPKKKRASAGPRKSVLRDSILEWMKGSDEISAGIMKEKYIELHGNLEGYYAFIKRLVDQDFVIKTLTGFIAKEEGA